MNNEKIYQHGEYELSELQSAIIETLKEFHNFCKQYDLTYYLGGGTLLGAIRHKGIIPWDDDIDIDMPRGDYERLIDLADKFPRPFIVSHFKIDNKFVYPFIKIYNPKIQVTEFIGEQSYTNGAWIDVFPIDGAHKSLILRRAHFNLVRLARVVFLLKVIGYIPPQDKSSKIFFLKKCSKPFLYFLSKPFSKYVVFLLMDRIASIKKFNKSEYVGAFYSPYGVKASFPREIYRQALKADFNGYLFDIPDGYDLFLTKQYGDYMRLPPLVERNKHNIKAIPR